MLFIETWIAILIMLIIFGFGFVGIVGWIIEGMRLDAQIEENRKLHHKVKKLQQRLARENAIENIRTANEYYKESKKND